MRTDNGQRPVNRYSQIHTLDDPHDVDANGPESQTKRRSCYVCFHRL